MLAIKNLVIGYGKTVVSSIPDFSLEAGQRILISGPSGCGKTTLFLTVSGLTDPLEGSVHVNGQNFHALKADDRDHLRGKVMGIVFQTLHLVRSLTVLQNVMLSCFLTKQPQLIEEARNLLDRMGILHLGGRPASEISQGQSQRVALARALIGNPQILLADEPTSSLDDAATHQVLDLMLELTAERQTSLLVSSHDARITDRFTKRVALGASL